MATQCIKVSLEDNPLNVLKGCSSIVSCLDDGFTENIYSYHAIIIYFIALVFLYLFS